jgi:RNA polymerase sigma factor (sigma-70 family)
MAQWEAELTELVMRRSGALVGYAYSLTRDKPQAEDLVQDALVKVYSRLRRPPGTTAGGQVVDLDGPRMTNVEAYVRRAILTIFLDGYRRRNHWSGIKHLLADDDRSPAADRVATARVDVGVALSRLSPRQREAVMLRFFEDMTVPQIATALGTRPGTIKRHLSDAMEVLRGSLAEAPAPEVDTNLDQRLGAVAGVVRRRRAAKVGAISGASLVVAGLLALAAIWGPARLLSEPVPPATPSPDAAVGGGWAPTGWEIHGPQYHCGMEVTALASTSDTVRVEITGDVVPMDGGELRDGGHLEAPIRITRTDAEGLSFDGRYPRLVFAQDGQVVDISSGWNEGGYVMPDAGKSADAVAGASAATACGKWTVGGVPGFEEYRDQRPAGTYDVYVVLPWSEHRSSGEGTGKSGLAVSEPVTMEIPAVELPDQIPLDVEIRDGYQPAWLEGTSLACGAYASDIPRGPLVPSERSGLRLSVEPENTLTFDEVTARFEETEGEAVDTTRTPITSVWLNYGRVVGVGRDVWSDPAENLRVEANGETSVVVPVEPDPTCLTNPDAGMPAGTYDLYVLAELDPGSDGERQFISANTHSQYYIAED